MITLTCLFSSTCQSNNVFFYISIFSQSAKIRYRGKKHGNPILFVHMISSKTQIPLAPFPLNLVNFSYTTSKQAKMQEQNKTEKSEAHENDSSLAQKIYAAVRCIPRGKVATYSQIAALASGNCNLRRYVGNALHKNPSNSVTPCHRVVNAKGFCSGSFAFGGPQVQQEKLVAEGIAFIQGHVDMPRFCITDEDFDIMRIEFENELRK